MPIPTVGLTALSIITPTLTSGSNTISVDTTAIALTVNADSNTTQVEVLVNSTITVLTTPTVVGGLHQFSGLVPLPATNAIVQLFGRNYDPSNSSDPNTNNPLLTPTVQFNTIYVQSQLAATIGPPTGITVYKGANSCQVEWAVPTYAGYQGVRVQYSTDAAGIDPVFTQFGNLATQVTRVANLTVGAAATSTAEVSSNGAPGYDYSTVTTTTANTKVTNFASVTIPSSLIASDTFYVILTSIVQDPNTNVVYESQAAGPLLCGFVDLQSVKPTDFLALQKATDIASRLIASMTSRQPTLDLTARAEARDILINPFALELANLSTAQWFYRCCRSISALSQIDDSNGDGISDPVATSTLKQQIAQALGLSNSDTQTFIDSRFDVIGESVGETRGGATIAACELTFFTYTQPTATVTVPVGAIVTTVPDSSSTTSVSFTTTGSAVLDASNLNSYYDPTNGWWSVTVPSQCNTSGSVGNVGARTIQQVTSGGPAGLSVINLLAANPAQDQQSNADYAAVIRNRQVTGVDSGTKNGLYTNAKKVPGVSTVIVVPSGDISMVRDWAPAIQRHVYGTVDIYVKGDSQSQQINYLPFTYPSTSTYGVTATYLPLTLLSASSGSFKITGYSTLANPLYTTVEIVAVSQGNVLYLGSSHAQIDNSTGVVTLDPTENVYQRNADGTTSIWQVQGVNATNLSFLQAVGFSNATFSLMGRQQAGIQYTPSLQPLTSVNSVSGPVTGTVDPANTELIRTSDFLLNGGSNKAGDQVVVSAAYSTPTTATLTLTGSPVFIDTAMDIGLDGNGVPTNILSLRSQDLSTLYEFGVDYNILSTGRYRSYALNILTNPSTGQPRIATGSVVIAAYNKFELSEKLTPVTDTIALSGVLASNLSTPGFVHNVWLPESYGNTSLSLDSGLIAAGIAWANRYIKVTYTVGSTTTVMVEGSDFSLAINPTTALASITRIIGGRIPDGAAVSVSYMTNEVFTITTEYPSYVQEVVTAIQPTQLAACSDILVKAMVSNAVDLTLSVTLDSATSPAIADPIIRNALSLLFSSSQNSLALAQITANVMANTGVTNTRIQKCAKSNGSYSIGEIIPTGVNWTALGSDPAFKSTLPPASTFITAAPVLQNPTIPSGGPYNAYVGLLYEGESYRRAQSVQDFLTGTGPAFYIIGTSDYIDAATPLDSTYAGRVMLMVPSTVTTPSLYSYRVTYQVFNASGASDITVSATEYLVPGTITIVYVGS